MGPKKLDMETNGTKKVGHGISRFHIMVCLNEMTWQEFLDTYVGGFVFCLFCPEELFVWQALGFQHFRLLGFHISDYWISTCPDSWKFRLPRFQFFGFPDFILWMFLYEMNSQEFLDNCLVFLLVLVSCSCEECKTCFFTYYRTQEHMYAHPGTFSKEAKAFILGI